MVKPKNSKKVEKRWRRAGNDNVRARWECPQCADQVYIAPAEYEGSGAPTCSHCDTDMAYVHTEVLV